MKAAAALADILLAVLLIGVLVIIVTGGGVFVVSGQRVSMMGVDNPLLALTLLGALRYATLRRVPVFGVGRWSITALEHRARTIVDVQHRFGGVAASDGRLAVLAAVAIATIVKVVLAAAYPGFFSGDDVEVQEMSLAALWHVQWPIWDLRNALFPLGVVYPVQQLFVLAGATDPQVVVFAGRLAVAAISSLTIVVVWRAGLRLWPSARGWAVLAAVLFASTQLHIAFGSSELPRPVATVFVVGAFVLLLRPAGTRVIGAAMLLGIAASLRFSEAIFLAPASLMLVRERRWALAFVLTAGAAATALAILALTDLLYWGAPLHSLNAAIDYTLVQRLSSRGYQNPLWYVVNIFGWLSPAIVVFAAIALISQPRSVDVWFWAPVVLLSLLPHKEARYMIPVVPFACLAAIRGAQIVTARIVSDAARPPWQAVAVITIACIGLAHDAGHWRLPRSNADVAFARRLAGVVPSDGRVAIEQAWRAGGRVYLHPREVLDLDPQRLADVQYLWQAVPPDTGIVLDRRTTQRHGLAEAMHARGYQRSDLTVSGSRYELWLPVTQRAASARAGRLPRQTAGR